MIELTLLSDAQLQYWTDGPAGANQTFPRNSLVRFISFIVHTLVDATLHLAV